MTSDGSQPELDVAQGPYFEELSVGQVFTSAPAITLTHGHAASHQAILGDRLRLVLDHSLAEQVVGAGPLAHPALVWNIAIGQSTLATHHVRANLFYRGLAFRHAPLIGDTLHTSTEVVGLRQNTVRPGRHPTGLAVLRITTVDQHGRPVLDFWRCAMLPLRDSDLRTGHADRLDGIGEVVGSTDLAEPTRAWRLDRFGSPRHGAVRPGQRIQVAGGDVVSSAPELARLTLNIAQVHHDHTAGGGRRLVYGGHTIGLALSQACRALPGMVTVLGWHGCDHTGPVHEGDTLTSAIDVEKVDPRPGGGVQVHLRSRVGALAEDGSEKRDVLDWRYVVLMAGDADDREQAEQRTGGAADDHR